MNFRKLRQFCFLLMIFVVVPFVHACGGQGVTHVREQSVYDRVMQSGKIRCGYLVWPPQCIKDPNTKKLSGIGIEALELVAKKLGLSIEWVEEVTMGTMSEGLATGRYDLVPTGTWPNANRAKVVAFSRPLFYSPLYIYVRKGDKRFKNHWQAINSPKIKVATVDGGTVELIAENDFPRAQKFTMPQLSDNAQLLLNVSTGKADVTIAEQAVANRYIENNPNKIECINPEKPVRVFADCWMFKRSEFEFKAMLDTVLDEVINCGAMDKIIAKYEKSPHEVLRVALPYSLPSYFSAK